MLLKATKWMSMWDLVEEFYAFRVWPLGEGWQLSLGEQMGVLHLIESEGLDNGHSNASDRIFAFQI